MSGRESLDTGISRPASPGKLPGPLYDRCRKLAIAERTLEESSRMVVYLKGVDPGRMDIGKGLDGMDGPEGS